jgi:hypothetical protein
VSALHLSGCAYGGVREGEGQGAVQSEVCNSDTTPNADGATCPVPANNNEYGDTGRDQVPKYLTVRYHCEKNGFSVPGSGRCLIHLG